MDILLFVIMCAACFASYMIGRANGWVDGVRDRKLVNPIVIVATQMEHTILAHDFTDRSFLCQAPTIEEICEIVKARYPDKTIIMANE